MKLKSLVTLLMAAVAHGAFGQAPAAELRPAACSPWVAPIDADEGDTSNLPAAFASPTVAQFQADWRKSLAAGPLNPVFPHARLFARTFETRLVPYLFERAVFQADARALALLVRLQESTNPSMKSDALAAVAFVNFQLNTPASRARGLALVQEAIKGPDSYPALVFLGRSSAWGGEYSAKNLQAAMAYLARAGAIPQQRQSEGRRMDTLNMQDVHAATLRHLLANEPALPYRDLYTGTVQQADAIDAAQVAFMGEYEKSEAFAEVNRATQALLALLAAPATGSGFTRLVAVLEGQERLAQEVHAPSGQAPVQAAVQAQVQAANERLAQALHTSSQQLITAQISEKSSDFSQLLRRIKALVSVQHGLSRSCSLAATWSGAAR